MRCDMCGAEADDLEEVHRLYLVPEPQRVDEPEQWCMSCRTQYPHEQDGSPGVQPARAPGA